MPGPRGPGWLGSGPQSAPSLTDTTSNRGRASVFVCGWADPKEIANKALKIRSTRRIWVALVACMARS